MGTSSGVWVRDVMPRKMGSDEGGDGVGTVGIIFLLVAILRLCPPPHPPPGWGPHRKSPIHLNPVWA